MSHGAIAIWFSLLSLLPNAPTPSDAVAWQAALDRAGFSPGVIDGRVRRKTEIALRAFQKSAGLAITGRTDQATRAALRVDSSPAIVSYTITPTDVANVGPSPKTWYEKAAASRLGYASLAALVSERGHCTIGLLQRLNPGVNLQQLRGGDTLRVPNVERAARPSSVDWIEIDFSEKLIHAVDRAGREIALFHCSIAKDNENRPRGKARVVVVRRDPDYLFDPKKWPEVKDVKKKLLIPPGPRNPVGLCWIGLSIPSYGIHGTPEPELIGKTGSHGCFRLANWDAVRLGAMVRVGTPVRFVESATVLTDAGRTKSTASLSRR